MEKLLKGGMAVTVMGMFLAFCAGMLATAIGSIGSVAITGLAVLVGIGVGVTGASYDFMGQIAFGYYLGPTFCFGPASVAAHYAYKKGYLKSSKDIVTPLASLGKPDVLVVGGLLGVISYLIVNVLNMGFAGRMDTGAATVFALGLIGKVIFSKRPLKNILGTTPENIANTTGRFGMFCPITWVKSQSTPAQIVSISLCAAGLSGYATYTLLQVPGAAAVAAYPGWAVGILCFFINMSGFEIPITHHMSIVGSYAVIAAYSVTGDVSAVIWGVAFGIAAGFTADVLTRVFLLYANGFVDPAAMSITVLSPFVMGLIPENVYRTLLLPIAMIALFLLIAVWTSLRMKRAAFREGFPEKQAEYPPSSGELSGDSPRDGG